MYTRLFLTVGLVGMTTTHALQQARYRVAHMATDEQFVIRCCKCATFVGLGCYSLYCYHAAQQAIKKSLREQQTALDTITQKYSNAPDAYTEEQLAKMTVQKNYTHTLREERDIVQRDRLQLIETLARLKKYNAPQHAAATERLEPLLKKLHALENSMSQAIAPFDLAMCVEKYEAKLRTLLAATDKDSLHEHMCVEYRNSDILYPYLACSSYITHVMANIKDSQKHVDATHATHQRSVLLYDKLHALYRCIISLPIYQEQLRNQLHDTKETMSLELQKKRLKADQKQAKHLENIERILNDMAALHTQELTIYQEQCNGAALCTAKLADKHATAEQKAIALQNFLLTAAKIAQNTNMLVEQQKKELVGMQQIQKNQNNTMHEKLEQLKKCVDQLMVQGHEASDRSGSESDGPGAAPKNFSMPLPSAPNYYPSL